MRHTLFRLPLAIHANIPRMAAMPPTQMLSIGKDLSTLPTLRFPLNRVSSSMALILSLVRTSFTISITIPTAARPSPIN